MKKSGAIRQKRIPRRGKIETKSGERSNPN